MAKKIIHILYILFLPVIQLQAQQTSLDIFGGSAYTNFNADITPVDPEFRIIQRFNPLFGSYFNIEFDSTFVIRPGASYLTKAYFFSHRLDRENNDLEAKVNQKIESFSFSLDLLYTFKPGRLNVRPFAGISYSFNSNNGGDILYLTEAEKYFIAPPVANVNSDMRVNTFGWRAGLGLQPKSFEAFELSLLYAVDLNAYPTNTYAANLVTETGWQEHKAQWKGRMSYFGIMLIVHLAKLV